jgi:aryl-alcohol dehydrogenase (NADP+)
MGRTGLKVSEICLGTMTFAGQCDEPTAIRILDEAAGRGVTFLDTADAYPVPPSPETSGRTEEVLGRWLQGRRDRFVVATKCRIRVGHGPNDQGLSRRHILAACEASLRRLKTDVIDLYQAHSPDPETPLDETLRAFDDLVRAGKVRYVGCSNYPAWQLALALGVSERDRLARYDCVPAAVQPALPRDRIRAAPPVPGPGRRGDRLQPPGRRLPLGQAPEGGPPTPGTRFTLGASGELYRDRYWQAAQFDAVEALKGRRRPARHPPGHGEHRLGPGAAGDHLGDRRRQPPRATGRHAGRRRDDARRRDPRRLRRRLVGPPAPAPGR